MAEVFRSTEPFFHRDEVHRAITSLAAVDSVVIYAGAGVTIDNTGLSWSRLVQRVLTDDSRLATVIAPDEAALVANHLQPVELASIAAQYYRGLHNDPADAQDDLETQIRGLLYPGNEWQSGLLAVNLIRLACYFASANKVVEIVTTNYDIHLEKERDRLAAVTREAASGFDQAVALPSVKWRNLKQRRRAAGSVAKPRSLKAGKVHITYLHGRLSPRGETSGRLALSEQDYAELRPEVHDVLSRIFAQPKTGLLILGSSLTDPPLLAALFDTREPVEARRQDQCSRVAIMPYRSFLVSGRTDPQDVALIERHIKARATEFGVRLLMPDGVFHLGQFCEEVIAASKQAPDAPYALTPAVRYGGRLRSWWSFWSTSSLTDEGAELASDHLLASLRYLEESLPRTKFNPKERFKLELWVRWDPDRKDRLLALYANSNGPRYNFETVRTAEIGLSSNYQAVHSFVSGRPSIICPEEGMPDGMPVPARSERWRLFINVPILYMPASGFGRIQVGVITLASTKAKAQSRLALSATGMGELIDNLRVIGEALLDPVDDRS